MHSHELLNRLHYWGRPLAWLYGTAVWLRNRAYDVGLLPQHTVPARVVSIGNISAGGSGKSELVVQLLQKHQAGDDCYGLLGSAGTIGVLSRGYKRRTAGCQVVSDGRELLLSPAAAGDEPCMIARRCPGVPVVVSEKRITGARLLVERFGVDTILLDDGFQHRALQRDLDLVLLDCNLPGQQQELLLPAGRMREPYHSLERAQVVLFNHCRSSVELTGYYRRIRPWFKGKALYLREAEFRLLDAVTGRETKVLPTAAVAGLADPSRFFNLLREQYQFTGNCLALPDHAAYDEKELLQLRELAAGDDARVVTTWKDAVKIPAALQSELRLLILEQKWQLGEMHET